MDIITAIAFMFAAHSQCDIAAANEAYSGNRADMALAVQCSETADYTNPAPHFEKDDDGIVRVYYKASVVHKARNVHSHKRHHRS